MKIFLALVLFFTFDIKTFAAIHSESVEYRHGDKVLEGYLAYDDSMEGKRPGVLVVHEWKGLGDYAKRRANELAQLGYIAFALDMYGKGVFAKTHDEAGKLAGIYFSDRTLVRARARAGLDVLLKHPLTDTRRVAAIGYCCGGTSVLELARSGAQIAGVVSFHGNLVTPHPGDAKNIKCKVLVLHGANDFFMKPDQVLAFQEEMRQAKVDWQMTYYGGCVHAFTLPEVGNDASTGLAYNELADKRSWRAMKDFFEEIFQKQ